MKAHLVCASLALSVSSADVPIAKKAGLSGYVGIQNTNAWSTFKEHIAWYSDYNPNTPTADGVLGVGMLWGAEGSACGDLANERLDLFKNEVQDTTPKAFFGFFEPDWTCPDSSDMSSADGAAAWNKYIAPLGARGTLLGSPSMSKQFDEDWLAPFRDAGLDRPWDVTSVHINKPDLDGVRKDVEYYATTYGKPVWVSEFACVQDQGGWAPCSDQSQVNQFIRDVVEYFESSDKVVAYGPSNGNGLGDTWPLTKDGELTESGRTYIDAIKNL